MILTGATSIYNGDSGVTKVYQGDAQVWPIISNGIIKYRSTDSTIIPVTFSNFWDNSSGGDVISNTYTISGGTILLDSHLTSVYGEFYISNFRNISNLEYLEVSASCQGIGYRALRYCNNLTEVRWANRAPVIDGISPRYITGNIGAEALAGCYNLTYFQVPNIIDSIGSNAFESCTSLSAITFPMLDSVWDWPALTTLGENCFYNCTHLTNITYEGTMADWAQVQKGTNWNYNVPATVVHCTDGDTPI